MGHKKLSPEEVRALPTILAEGNERLTGVRFVRELHGLGGSMGHFRDVEEDETKTAEELAGTTPFYYYGGICVRALVGDVVYLTRGAGEHADVIELENGRGHRIELAGGYDAEECAFIFPVMEKTS